MGWPLSSIARILRFRNSDDGIPIQDENGDSVGYIKKSDILHNIDKTGGYTTWNVQRSAGTYKFYVSFGYGNSGIELRAGSKSVVLIVSSDRIKITSSYPITFDQGLNIPEISGSYGVSWETFVPPTDKGNIIIVYNQQKNESRIYYKINSTWYYITPTGTA